MAAGCAEWETTIVGHFIGSRLNFPAVNNIAPELWGKEGLVDVLSSENGLHFFKFLKLDSVEKILEGGPWQMMNRPIVLRNGKGICLC